MLRTTISKFRQVCALTFVPRLFRGDLRCAPDRFEKLSVCVQSRVDKSTSSKQEKDECERCQRIIDQAFSPPGADVIDMDARHKEAFMNMVTPELPTPPENQCEKCQRIINQIFGDENAGDRKREAGDPVCIPMTELQATTAKEQSETLAQKIEKIDETPLVEAQAKLPLEGFNVHPKVLGNRKKRKIGERITALSFTSDKNTYGRRKGTAKRDDSFDELAKRCLDSPSSHIDERLLKEMEKLGVPPSTRKGSRRTAHDVGIVQPEIMKRPRRPVAKTELDFLTMRRARLLRLKSDLPPPFELTHNKANSINLVSCSDCEDRLLRYERLPTLKDQILTDEVGLCDDTPSGGRQDIAYYLDNRPPQQLLGHMTAAVMSDGNNAGRGGEDEQLVDRPEQGTSRFQGETSAKSSAVLHAQEDERISLSKLKELENEHDKLISREKLASAHILTELVDPKEISPRAHSSGMVKEEIEMLKNLLRTRVEYLTQEKTKRLNPMGGAYTDAASEFDRVVMKEFTETEVTDTLQQLGVDVLRLEKFQPTHLKDSLNIESKETSSLTEPSVLVKEFTEPRSMKDADPIMFRGYSHKHEMVTPHQLFEQLSIISREAEVGVLTDELSDNVRDTVINERFEINQEASNRSTQLIDNVGMVPKHDNPQGPSETKNPHVTLSEKYDSNHPHQRYKAENLDYGRLFSYEKTQLIQDESDESRLERMNYTYRMYRELKTLGEEPEDHIVPVETSRLPRLDTTILADHHIVTATKEPVQRESPGVARETILNPLLEKGTVAHVGDTQSTPTMPPDTTSTPMPTAIHTVTLPKRDDPNSIPLSELLKRVRDRNRMQFFKEYQLRMAAEVDPLLGKCGKKQPPCPPPAPHCPPPPPKPCPPVKPPCPDPCKPKCPPPAAPPDPCAPKHPCPPSKKSPCEKFQKVKCSDVRIQDALTLLLYLGPQFHVPQKLLPILACSFKSHTIAEPDSVAVERTYTSLHNLFGLVLVAGVRKEVSAFSSAVAEDSKDYARTYDPWIPIPSWPIPVKQEKRDLVCPKDGCKVSPPKLNPPCRDINPCLNFPKKHFSIVNLISEMLGHKVYHIGDF